MRGEGGASVAEGVCIVVGACVAGRRAWQGGVQGGGGHAWQGACVAGGMHRRGACVAGGVCGHHSGQYASYWNALLSCVCMQVHQEIIVHSIFNMNTFIL